MIQKDLAAARAGNFFFASSIAILVIRLALGWVFIYHGSQKTFGWFGGDNAMNGQSAMDLLIKGVSDMPVLPAKMWAYMAAYGELIGGISVMLGALARLGAIPILVTMFVAIAKVHGKGGFSMANGGYEYNFVLIAMAAAVLIAGPGLVSVDAFIFRKGLWARGPQPLSKPEARS